MEGTAKQVTKNTKTRTYLTPDEKTALQELLPTWSEKDGKRSREAYLNSTIVPRIQQLNLPKFSDDILGRDKEAKKLWEKRIQAVRVWLKNNKPFKNKSVFKVERKISLRRVISKLKPDEIESLIMEEHPLLQKGDRLWPSAHQKAVTKILASMSESEKAEMEKEREKWSKQGPPMDVRLSSCKKYSKKAVENMHQALFKEMYVNAITFEFHLTPDRRLSLMCHDYISAISAKFGGNEFLPFSQFNPEAYKRIQNELVEYARYVRGITENIHYEPSNATVKNMPVLLEGPGGLPLIPPPTLGVKGEETAENAGIIIRKYFTRHFRLATGTTVAHPPWEKFRKHPEEFFESKCLPAKFVLQDPSRMGRSVKILIEYLRQRQGEHGVNAFHFHHVYQNNKIQPSCYPPEAEKVISSGSGKPKAKRAMATEITVDEPPIIGPASPKPFQDPNMPASGKTEDPPKENNPDQQLILSEEAKFLPKAEASEVIKMNGGIPAVWNEPPASSSGITAIGSVHESGKPQPKSTSNLSLGSGVVDAEFKSDPGDSQERWVSYLGDVRPIQSRMLSDSEPSTADTRDMTRSGPFSNPYGRYFPFPYQTNNPSPYHEFPPAQFQEMRQAVIDPQLLPQGPVRFEVLDHLPSGFPGSNPRMLTQPYLPPYMVQPYPPFPPAISGPILPTTSVFPTNMPVTTKPPKIVSQNIADDPPVQIIPPTTTPLKRKRCDTSESPTASRSVRRGSRIRTPRKLPDHTLASLPKGKS